MNSGRVPASGLPEREPWQQDLIDRNAATARDLIANPRYFIWRCPVCFRQHRGPGGHPMAGDTLCQGTGPDGEWHSARLERIAVVPEGGGQP